MCPICIAPFFILDKFRQQGISRTLRNVSPSLNISPVGCGSHTLRELQTLIIRLLWMQTYPPLMVWGYIFCWV